jgi:hypothetical protein
VGSSAPHPTSNLEDQVSIFISPGDWVAQLYPQAPSTHFSRLLRHASATMGLFFSRSPHGIIFNFTLPFTFSWNLRTDATPKNWHWIHTGSLWQFLFRDARISWTCRPQDSQLLYISSSVHVEVFRIVSPCSVAVGYWRFRGPCCLHLQGEVTIFPTALCVTWFLPGCRCVKLTTKLNRVVMLRMRGTSTFPTVFHAVLLRYRGTFTVYTYKYVSKRYLTKHLTMKAYWGMEV